MTTAKKQRAIDAGSFVDEVLNDILSAPENEVLEDDDKLTEARGESADDFVQRAVQASVTAVGKARFAKTAAELRRSEEEPHVRLAPADLERAKRSYLESLKSTEKELSLAARRGTKVTKSDLDSAIEDLTELQRMQKRRPKK